MVPKNEIIENIGVLINSGNIGEAKKIAQEYNRQEDIKLCLTSRHIKAFRILDEVINTRIDTTDEEQKGLMEELVQIVYTLEQGLLEMKSEEYCSLLKRTNTL